MAEQLILPGRLPSERNKHSHGVHGAEFPVRGDATRCATRAPCEAGLSARSHLLQTRPQTCAAWDSGGRGGSERHRPFSRAPITSRRAPTMGALVKRFRPRAHAGWDELDSHEHGAVGVDFSLSGWKLGMEEQNVRQSSARRMAAPAQSPACSSEQAERVQDSPARACACGPPPSVQVQVRSSAARYLHHRKWVGLCATRPPFRLTLTRAIPRTRARVTAHRSAHRGR